MLQRHDMLEPLRSNPAAPPRDMRRAPITLAFAVIAAAAAILLAVSMGGRRPVPTPPALGSAATTGHASAVVSPVAELPTPVPTTAETSPTPEPTLDPGRLKACAPESLAMAAGGWSGATGSMGGGATLLNVSNEACRIDGIPSLELHAHDGTVIAKGTPATPGDPVAMRPGGAASVIAVWMNWCGDPPARPLTLRLSVAGESGNLAAEVRPWEGSDTSVPRCDAPGSPSTIGVPQPFEAVEPELGDGPVAPCAAGDLEAFLGSWGAAAGTSYAPVVILNRTDVACSISTSPHVELLDAGGKYLETNQLSIDDGSTVDVAAGSTVITFLGFSDWCIAAPKLPFHFDLRVGGEPVPIVATSRLSEIGLPYCNSAPATPRPLLFWSDPFVMPGS